MPAFLKPGIYGPPCPCGCGGFDGPGLCLKDTMNNKIIIRVLGRSGVGKSTMLTFIEKSLHNAGFLPELVETKFTHEADHSRPFDVRWDVLKDPRWRTHISIQEQPTFVPVVGIERQPYSELIADDLMDILEQCSGCCLDDPADRTEVANVLSRWLMSSISEGIREGMKGATEGPRSE